MHVTDVKLDLVSCHKQAPLLGDYKIVVINMINDLKGRRFILGPIDFSKSI